MESWKLCHSQPYKEKKLDKQQVPRYPWTQGSAEASGQLTGADSGERTSEHWRSRRRQAQLVRVKPGWLVDCWRPSGHWQDCVKPLGPWYRGSLCSPVGSFQEPHWVLRGKIGNVLSKSLWRQLGGGRAAPAARAGSVAWNLLPFLSMEQKSQSVR